MDIAVANRNKVAVAIRDSVKSARVAPGPPWHKQRRNTLWATGAAAVDAGFGSIPASIRRTAVVALIARVVIVVGARSVPAGRSPRRIAARSAGGAAGPVAVPVNFVPHSLAARRAPRSGNIGPAGPKARRVRFRRQRGDSGDSGDSGGGHGGF